ncbi:retrovirus-related Pol polyprotein from type-2 retrotransposable element R2DM [Trichonephila clavipes]|nr:retrovirus-related Pol polyprotein from type-2 retrotransposable element R2DM [Trichonephila clavipes]
MLDRHVETWCAPCGKRIVNRLPTKHPCLVNLDRNREEQQEGAWQCPDCEDRFATKMGLANHKRSHKRERLVNELPALNIPEGPRQRRMRRREQLAPLTTGEPGNMRLAPPPDHIQATQASPGLSQEAQGADNHPNRERIDLRVPSALESFVAPLDTLLQVDEIGDARGHFEDLVNNVTLAVYEHFHLQQHQRSGNTSVSDRAGLDLANPQKVQQAYKWNRRKCVRAITQNTSQRCPVSMEETYDFFKAVWETSSSPEAWSHGEVPTRPPIVESLSSAFVAECLRAAENSAPGEDMIAYRHWREIDPDCVVLTRIFDVCIKLADIPSAWKSSRTILIHKKGDVSKLENWRPISLSNTVYKLFTKCLARKLSEWCEIHEVLSPAQKGFSPYDGVLEHNFLLTQHLETARRCKTDKFVAWLDISNAFGSVPRQVILDSLVDCGADQDFITLVCSMYHGSNTSVLTEEGQTPPIQLKNGVKEGSPLSGILFNLSIDSVTQITRKQGTESSPRVCRRPRTTS